MELLVASEVKPSLSMARRSETFIRRVNPKVRDHAKPNREPWVSENKQHGILDLIFSEKAR
jgi:hypothetical protein